LARSGRGEGVREEGMGNQLRVNQEPSIPPLMSSYWQDQEEGMGNQFRVNQEPSIPP